MIPLVLVKSYGRERSSDVIKGVLKSNNEEYEIDKLEFQSHEIKAYKTNIVTKYFKTQICLFEWDDIATVPNDIVASVEGVIVYFDPDDTKFLLELDVLNNFVALNGIEASYLITKNICENGAVYDEIKRVCKTQFAVIDLKEPVVGGEQDEYFEVVDLLKNNVWSNVNVERINHLPFNCGEQDEDGEELTQLDEESIERDLNDFEDLINSIQNFKIMSQNMSREDVLDNAEKLAEHFAKILKDD